MCQGSDTLLWAPRRRDVWATAGTRRRQLFQPVPGRGEREVVDVPVALQASARGAIERERARDSYRLAVATGLADSSVRSWASSGAWAIASCGPPAIPVRLKRTTCS